MKVIYKSILLLLVAFAVAVSSCSDDNSEPLGGDKNGQLFTAKIDGDKFSSLPDQTEAMITKVQGVTSLSVGGKDVQERDLAFTVSGFTGVGRYELKPDGGISAISSAMYFEGDDDDTQMWTTWLGQGEAGKIVVTAYSPNKSIKETFQFEVYNSADKSTKSFTEGVFDVSVS